MNRGELILAYTSDKAVSQICVEILSLVLNEAAKGVAFAVSALEGEPESLSPSDSKRCFQPASFAAQVQHFYVDRGGP